MQLADNAFTQAELGLRHPRTESVATVVYVDGQKKTRSDCTEAQAYMDLSCSYMA